jgi:ubiquinone/menaquinone biosynthesis C-methylase UbiE
MSSVRIDPEKRELTRLLAYAGNMQGMSVLEVGCGNGRLTHQYAHLARRVAAIDPNAQRIAQATANTPPGRPGSLTFHAIDVETFIPDERFDLVLLSWSL